MRYLTLIILFLSNTALVSGQNLEFKLTTTGSLFRHVAILEIENKTDHIESINIPPLYIFDEELDQGIIVPLGRYVEILPKVEKKIALEGFHIFAEREILPANKIYDWEKVLKESREISREDVNYSNIGSMEGARKLMASELMPFDYVLLIPEDVDIFHYKIDHNLHQKTFAAILLKQAKLLLEGYDRMYYAGKIITHFNNDPYFEKNVFLQNSVWICSSGLEGIAFKKVHIKREMRKYYKLLVGKVKKKDNSLIPSLETYYSLYEQIGRESKVFLPPTELDKRKPCLPPDFSFRPISLGVRSPMIATRRYDELPIRNQKAVERNNCYPCVAEEKTYQIVRVFLSELYLNEKRELTNQVIEDVTASIFNYSPEFKNYFANYQLEIENIRNFNFDSWLMDNNLTDNEIVTAYFDDYFKKKVEKIDPKSANDKYNRDELKILEYLLKIYKKNNYEFSLDCCDLFKKPQDFHYRAAKEINLWFDKMKSTVDFLKPETTEISTLSEKELIEYLNFLQLLELEYQKYQLISDFYISFSDKNNKYFIPGVNISSDIEAERFLMKEFNIDFEPEGAFDNNKITFDINDKNNLTIHFSTSNCGEMRETHLPFIISPMLDNPGSLVIDEYRPIQVKPKFGLSIHGGFTWTDMAGSDKFTGGGSAFINEQIDFFDLKDTFNLLYPNYLIGEPAEIEYERSISYGIRFEYDLTDKFQLGFNVGYDKFWFSGFQDINYGNNQVDRGVFSGNITKFNLNLSGRYYFLGEILRPFGGINMGVGGFNNTFSHSNFTHYEFQMLENDVEWTYNAGPHLGLRFYPNQDFFIDLTGLLKARFDKNLKGESVTGIDQALFAGFGMRF
jgi:hypothetical protein